MEPKYLKIAIVLGSLGLFWLIGGLALVDASTYFLGLGAFIAATAGTVAWGSIVAVDDDQPNG